MTKQYFASLFGALCVGLFCAPASALDLSLLDAIEKITAQSNDLKKADANLKKAEASLDSANANRWFKLDGSVSYMNMVNVENPTKSNAIQLPAELGGILADSLGMDVANIEEIFAGQEIDRLFINFPDPWPRKKKIFFKQDCH